MTDFLQLPQCNTRQTNDPNSAEQQQQSEPESNQSSTHQSSSHSYQQPSSTQHRLAGSPSSSANASPVIGRNMPRHQHQDTAPSDDGTSSSLDGSVFAADGTPTAPGALARTRRSQTSESITSSNFNYSLNRRFISKNQMKEFREAFRLFDKDNDGSITKEELGTVMRSLGQFARVEELQEMLLEIDVDGDGNVSFEEFVDIMSNMTDTVAEASADQEERELRDAFRVFDKHNRGYITASDLRAVLQCLGEDLDEEEIEDMIKEVDVDGDGRIDFYEFVHALGEPEDSQENDDEEDPLSPPSLSCDVNA
ncbi:calmodulin [Culex quinquefasciatus]|uniref:Calmodulin n=1 Tax=Culex quinquefasciatus TaxID=7176 RepID=B0WSH2_CULQU|nr:calmodulin [Culex quinquefasciatus]|eukprot:XP_001852053.1 calmodulin [Culex quinquefasciatus]